MDLNDFTNHNFASPKPVLTEPGVKYFLSQTLKQCHIIKNNFHNTVINIGLFIAFLLILGLILLYKYKGRLTDVEKHKKNQEKQLVTHVFFPFSTFFSIYSLYGISQP